MIFSQLASKDAEIAKQGETIAQNDPEVAKVVAQKDEEIEAVISLSRSRLLLGWMRRLYQ